LFQKYRERDLVELRFQQSWFYRETHWGQGRDAKWPRLREINLERAEKIAEDDAVELDPRPEVAAFIKEFNEMYYVVGNFGGKCRICAEVESALFPGAFDFVHQSFADFSNRYMHQVVKVGEKKGGWT
jgi:hypothetical protein